MTFYRMMLRAGIAATVVLAPSRLDAQTMPAFLPGARLEVLRVEAAGDALQYQYRVVNPAASPAGIEQVGLDLSAPPGTGFLLLPGSDRLSHAASAPHTVSLRDHVPVAVRSPGAWKAIVGVEGEVRWLSETGGITRDSLVPAGSELDGFGLRSTWLPGPREYWLEPDWAVCCSQPKDTIVGEHPDPWDFRATGVTVGPAVPPNTLTVSLLQAQLAYSCNSGWIRNRGVCRSLEAKLAQAEELDRRGQTNQWRAVLRAFMADLSAQHGPQPGKHVSDAAFAMLMTNVQVLLNGH